MVKASGSTFRLICTFGLLLNMNVTYEKGTVALKKINLVIMTDFHLFIPA
jgi:hypothetical protein